MMDTKPSKTISRGARGNTNVESKCKGDRQNRSRVYWNAINTKPGNISIELKSRAVSSKILNSRHQCLYKLAKQKVKVCVCMGLDDIHERIGRLDRAPQHGYSKRVIEMVKRHVEHSTFLPALWDQSITFGRIH